MSVLSVVVSKLSEQRLAKLGYHGRLVCEVCGHEDRVHVAHCFRTGFPQHCGRTMTLHKEDQTVLTDNEINAICTVIVGNRDIMDALEAKGVSKLEIEKLCEQAKARRDRLKEDDDAQA